MNTIELNWILWIILDIQGYKKVKGYCASKGHGNSFPLLDDAIDYCDKNIECNSIFDHGCDLKNPFIMCIGNENLDENKSDFGSCVYKKGKILKYCSQ